MKLTDHQARTLVDAAATIAGMTTSSQSRLYQDDPEPSPVPCYVTDPQTGRRVFVSVISYPASQAGRLRISAVWAKDSKGLTHTPRRLKPTPATLAPDTTPERLAKRLRLFMDEAAGAFAEAEGYARAADDYAGQTAATAAALVAAGWTAPRRPDAAPTPPRFPGAAYIHGEQVHGDKVSFETRSLTPAQAAAITRILATPDDDPLAPIRRLVDLAAAQLDQSATAEGLANCDAIAAARRLVLAD